MSEKKYAIKWVIVIFFIIMIAGMMLSSPYAINGAKNGIYICLNSLIPSLFPFMILSTFVYMTPINSYLCKILSPITRNIFHLSEKYSAILLFSMIGGYPIGAKILGEMLDKSESTPQSIERMLCFCVNCGPAFLIGNIGIGMYNSVKVGIILFVSQILSSTVIASVTSSNKVIPKQYYTAQTTLPIYKSLVESITKSTFSMLTICGFVVAFASIISMLDGLHIFKFLTNAIISLPLFRYIDGNIIEGIITGVIEVTTGTVKIATLAPKIAIPLISFITSFSGISVFCQIFSCFENDKINFKPFIISRFANAFLSSFITLILIKFFPNELNIIATNTVPQFYVNANSIIYTVCMLTMCSFLILYSSFKYKK